MIRKLMQLSAWQWLVMLGSVIIVPYIYSCLRLCGYKKTLNGVRSADTARSGLSAGDEAALAKQMAYAMAVAVKFGFWKPNCLTRSLALGWFLGRRGIPFEIRIGVPDGVLSTFSTDGPTFTAHAWVESSGVVLNEKEDVASEYSPFESGLDKHS